MKKNKYIILLLAMIVIAAFCVAVVFVIEFLTYISERLHSPIKLIVFLILYIYASYQLCALIDNKYNEK